MPVNKEKEQNLYNIFVEDGFDIPETYDLFSEYMQDPTYRKQLYDRMYESYADTPWDYDTFEKKFGYVPEQQTSSNSPSSRTSYAAKKPTAAINTQ